MCIHNTFYHNMIFKTINGDELGKTEISINNGFKELFNGDSFKKQSVLSNSDISALKAYNAEIKRGVLPMTAYYKTMQESSDTAVNAARSAGNASEVYEKLLEIQNLSDDFKFNNAFSKNLTKLPNLAKDVSCFAIRSRAIGI